jgi:hypothetical protein
MYVDGKMKPVETIPELQVVVVVVKKENGGRSEFKYDTFDIL